MGSFPYLLFQLVSLGFDSTYSDDVKQISNYNECQNERNPENPCIVPRFANCKFIFFRVSPYVIFPFCFIAKLIFPGRKVTIVSFVFTSTMIGKILVPSLP